MVVLDSDILIGLLRGDSSAYSTLERLEKKGEKLNTTAINASELLEGAMLQSDHEKKCKQVEDLLMSFGFYDFGWDASWVVAEISSQLKKKGEVLDFQDIAIAAISKLNDEILVTRNARHFGRIKGLRLEEW